MLSDLSFSLQITAPVFIIIGLGYWFKRLGWINDAFAKLGSNLVFKVTLPCLLFVKLSKTEFTQGLPIALILYALLATITVFVLMELIVTPLLHHKADRGVVVQGAYRSNMGIIGLAFCISAFGEAAVATASVYLAVMTILFNILAVVTLSRHSPVQQHGDWTAVLLEIAKNPLIVAILLGILVSVLNVPIPSILIDTGEYFASMTLPLALVCAGASIRINELATSLPLYLAAALKLIVIPLLITLGGALVGFRGVSLGVLYLMCAAPTAAASYPMVHAMRGNHNLAAAIIVVTSLGSIVFTTLGIFILRVTGMI